MARPRWIEALTAALLLISLGGAAAGQTSPQPGAAATPAPTPAAPAPIPVPEIATRAEQVAELLQHIDRNLQPVAELQAIEAAAPELVARLEASSEDTAQIIADGAPLHTLERLTSSWQTARTRLEGWSQTLTERVTQLEGFLQEIVARREEWAVSRTEAVASKVPAPVIERIDATLDALRSTQQRTTARRSSALTLQDQVSSALTTCSRAISDVAEARISRVGRVLVRDSRPVWLIDLGARSRALAAKRILAEELRASSAELGGFLAAQAAALLVELLLAVGLVVAFRRARARSRQWRAADPQLERSARIFERPYSSAILLAVLAVRLLHPSSPHGFDWLTSLLAVVPALRLLRRVAPAPLVPVVGAVAVFLLLDVARGTCAAIPQLEQALLLVELLAAMALLAWLLLGRAERRERIFGALPVGRPQPIARLFLLVLATAFVAAALGYTQLARMLGGSALASTYIALLLYAGMRAAEGLVAFALREPPLALLNSVQRHRALLEHRVHRVLVWSAVVTWLLAMLRKLALDDLLVRGVRSVLELDVAPSQPYLTIADVVVVGVTVWAAFLASRLIRFVLAEEVYPRVELPRGMPFAISTLLHYVVLTGGFVLALGAIGLDLNRFTILAGAFGVGIGFGLQNVVNNFTSGLILLFERPVQVGDTVQIGEVIGDIRRIGIRSSTLRTPQGAEVIVPNGDLIAEQVTNWTLTDRMRRVDIAVGVAYGSDPEQILDLLRSVGRAHPAVIANPPPLALFTGFGQSSLDFELRVWTGRFDEWMVVRSDLGVALHAALRDAGIEIPFPQRDVRLRGLPGDIATPSAAPPASPAQAPGKI